ncbi:hypothetical protein BCR36DRAFT_408078 [Piromyces finnis]|uniref:Uncharacterized protein n=1 Tax=Piromyces finnis TaxID=1754191 RepID=A0A1Y1VNW6_9FUNG|nr:hypothetical protein BCR36DRAFT_408078 [Piromyces finnis]|eukprot:ORX61097.1 hypothetical protein BCR36DRAFT_408078 [Piromyces finnis]
MHWFYGLIIMALIFYVIISKLPEPPKDKDTTSSREIKTSTKTKKKKNKKAKSKAQTQQVQAKLNQKMQKKNTPPKGKSNELDENEWPSLDKINEEKKEAAKTAAQKQKNKAINNNNEFNITHYDKEISDVNSSSNIDDSDEHVKKSSDKPVVIQNVSLPVTNRRYRKHIVQENQKYISSDDEEISDGEIKVVRVVEKKEEFEKVELPPEVDGWKNVVPKKANVLVIKSASSPTPVVYKDYIRKPKEEPLTKKQKENRKKNEKKKLEKQRERELQEQRLRQHRLEQQRLNVGYKYVAPPKPKSNTVKSKQSKVAPAPIINSNNSKSQNGMISATVPANGITSLWG